MSAHRVLADISRAAILNRLADPGSETVIDFAGKSFGVLLLTSSGTRLLPSIAEAGTALIVVNQSGGNIAIEDSSSASGYTVGDDKVALFIATGSTGATTSWNYFGGTALGS